MPNCFFPLRLSRIASNQTTFAPLASVTMPQVSQGNLRSGGGGQRQRERRVFQWIVPSAACFGSRIIYQVALEVQFIIATLVQYVISPGAYLCETASLSQNGSLRAAQNIGSIFFFFSPVFFWIFVLVHFSSFQGCFE